MLFWIRNICQTARSNKWLQSWKTVYFEFFSCVQLLQNKLSEWSIQFVDSWSCITCLNSLNCYLQCLTLIDKLSNKKKDVCVSTHHRKKVDISTFLGISEFLFCKGGTNKKLIVHFATLLTRKLTEKSRFCTTGPDTTQSLPPCFAYTVAHRLV